MINRIIISFVLLIGILGCSAGIKPVKAQSWQRFRADNQLRGRVDLKTFATIPPNQFINFQLGGGAIQPQLGDLDGDGKNEIIYLRQGRINAVTQEGTLRFDTFIGASDIVTVIDLDQNNSSREIVALDSERHMLIVINADGTLRWQYQFPEFVTLSPNYFKIADLVPERPGLEIVAFPDHTKTPLDANGYFFSSTGELYAKPVVPNQAGGQLNFPQMAIGDIDGSGVLSVVVVGRPKLFIFSNTGELKQQFDFREGDAEGRHYGLMTLADVTGDGRPEIVIIADDIPALSNNNKSAALTVLQITPTLKRLWGTTFPQQTLHGIQNSITDLDGDGRAEIVVNVWTGSQQQMRVYRGEGDTLHPGQPLLLTTIVGAYIWDIRDLDGDGRPELLATNENVELPSLSLNSSMRFLRLAAQSGNTMVFLDSAKSVPGMYILTRPTMSNINNFLLTGSSDTSRMRALTLEGTETRVLTYAQSNIPDKVNLQELIAVYRANNDKFRIKVDFDVPRPGVIRALLDSTPGNESFLVSPGSDNGTSGELAVYTRKKEKLKVSPLPPIQTGSGFTTEIRAADLDEDGSNELLVRAASGRVLILKYESQLNALTQIGSFAGNRPPIIEVLDGTKTRPQILTTVNDHGRLRVTVYNTTNLGDGMLKVTESWGRTFDDIPASAEVEFATGHFTGPSRADIFLSTPRGRSMVLSSIDGSTIWQRNDVYTFGNHIAIRDGNGDGREEIFIVSDNLFRILDGARGLELAPPINVASIGGDFGSTPMLSGVNEILLVGPGSVIKLTDQGKLLWNFTKTIGGKLAQRQTRVLMGLAELGDGGGFDRVGGNFGENDLFYVYDYNTGLLSYRTPYQPITEIITANIDGGDGDEFVFGTADGQIVALHAQDGSLLWAVKVDSFPHDPVLVGIGVEKRPALVFSPGDGSIRLYFLN